MAHRIVTDGDPALRETLPLISEITDYHLSLAEEMIAFAQKNKGLGLAANQLGLNERMFIALLTNDDQDECADNREDRTPYLFFNPEIIEFSDEVCVFEEGCFSIPNFYEDVERPSWVVLRYMDQYGKSVEERFDGFNARIIQHETDHMNGILFTDYLNRPTL